MTFTTILFWIFWVSLACSLVFSTISYALRTFSRVKLEEYLTDANRPGALETILATRFDLALTAAVLRLIMNVSVILSVGWYFELIYPDQNGFHAFKVFGCTILLVVPALLIMSVAIPQAWAKYAGEHLLALTWPFLRLAHFALWPAVRVLKIFDEIVRRLAGASLDADDEAEADAVEQEILSVVAEGTAEGKVDEDQKHMIEAVISFRDLQVGQIMTPRTEMVAVEVNAPLTELRDKILKEGLSRVPVYEGTLDNVVGIFYAKDLLMFLDTANLGSAVFPPKVQIELRKIMRPPLFVPRTKPLRDLLREFRIQQVHLAVVLDEYGGTSGLVTTEDILEEIVGDIADEYERPATDELKKLDDRTVEVDARMNISELNRALSLSIPEDADFQTIGGFVVTTLGVIPARGEKFQHDGISITVLDAEPRRVKKLRLDLPDPHETPEPAPLQ